MPSARQSRSAGNELGLTLVLRSLGAASLIGAASQRIDDVDAVHAIGFALAFVWLPAGYLADRVRIAAPTGIRRVAAAIIDAAGPALVVFAHPETADGALAALVALAALHLFVGDRVLGTQVSIIGGIGLAAGALSSDVRVLDGAEVVAAAAALAGLVVISNATSRDRTRASRGLLRMQERSEAILSGVGEAVVVTSGRGRIRQWNQAAAITFDCPESDAIGDQCEHVLGLRQDVTLLDCSSGCPLLDRGDQEAWRLRADGERQPFLVVASAVRDDDGTPVEVVHSLRDITTLKQADEAKTMFLATTSHELKTPLAVIQGFSGMLLDAHDVPPRHRAGLEAIHRRTVDLAGIVDRLLMSSRIESGRVDLTPTAVDVVPLVHERVAAIRASQHRSIELHAAPGVAPAVADDAAIVTVVDHLLDNAIKYSPDGGTISVEVGQRGPCVEIAITDEGIGMTPTQVERCFERFWQAEPSDVRRFGGTGIGLYIVRSLVDAMRGEISIESTLGEGTCFRISLGVHGAEVPAESPIEVEPQGEPSIIREFMRQVGVGGDVR